MTEFDFDAVFNVDDYLFYYGDTLTDDLSDRQVARLVDWLGLEQPLDILDLACGFGRHANRLAERGHRVTGTDLMEGFLEIARQDAKRRAVTVRYQQGDMRQLAFQQAFDVVLLLFTAFGYFSDAENLDVLRRIAQALRPGGKFVLDINNRDAFMKNLVPSSVTEKDGCLLIDMHRFEPLTGRLHARRMLVRAQERKDMTYSIRMYNACELSSLLSQVGLRILQTYGSWDGRPLDGQTNRLIVVAQKA